jgi:hypothetical protein
MKLTVGLHVIRVIYCNMLNNIVRAAPLPEPDYLNKLNSSTFLVNKRNVNKKQVARMKHK